MSNTDTGSPGFTFFTDQAPQIESRFPPTEIAVLDVNGMYFSDWESIWLQHRWSESFAYFRFIAAERTPPPADWQLLQFKPGDNCKIWLAGQPALQGLIVERQVSYDANRHQVQLLGKSLSHWGYKSSVDTPTGNFDGMTLSQVFEQVMSGYPGGTQIIGEVNPIPFAKLQNEKGELTWDFLERIARPRGAVLGATAFGQYLLIGQHAFPVVAFLKEGLNIKACECVISRDVFYNIFEAVGQTAGSDQAYGSQTNEMKCPVTTIETVYSKLIIPAEQPVKTQGELCDRAYNEAKWHIGTEITANIVVYGWTYDGTNIWYAGQNVFVDSPMAMLNLVLKVRTVTFEQSDRTGTQTTLECVAPWLLNDAAFDWSPPPAGAPQAPTPNQQGTPAPNVQAPTEE